MSGSSIEIFTELREIFPFVPLNSLKNAASYYKHDRASLNAFVQGCLGMGYFPEFPIQTDFELEHFLRAEFQTLKELLPDADPAFIEEIFNTHAGTAGMEAAVMEAIVHNSYPKRNVPKRKNTKFDVQVYCELVPDPLGSFSHRNYIMTENMLTDAVNYLMKIFGEDKRSEITSVVKEQQSLYLSYKKLREDGDEAYAQFFTNVKTVQPKTFDNSPDYGQVFEKLFIENEGNILSFLNKKREEEKQRNQRECCICLGLSPNIIKICTDGHEMCAQCVKACTELLYHEGTFFFPCTFVGCDLLLSNAVVRSVWDTSLYSKLLEDRIRISKADELVVCPFCNFQNGNSDSPEICCKNCLKKFCVTCQKVSHLPLECNKREDDLCKLVEEKMTEALIRKCPKCKRPFIKERQCCNKMWCEVCNIYICYVCRKVLPDNSYNHFYGQGQLPTEALGRCPLYSDINKLHVNSVITSGTEMLNEIKSNNPDLKLLYDPLAVLPKKEESDAVPNQF